MKFILQQFGLFEIMRFIFVRQIFPVVAETLGNLSCLQTGLFCLNGRSPVTRKDHKCVHRTPRLTIGVEILMEDSGNGTNLGADDALGLQDRTRAVLRLEIGI